MHMIRNVTLRIHSSTSSARYNCSIIKADSTMESVSSVALVTLTFETSWRVSTIGMFVTFADR
jgi:hypothetical protein